MSRGPDPINTLPINTLPLIHTPSLEPLVDLPELSEFISSYPAAPSAFNPGAIGHTKTHKIVLNINPLYKLERDHKFSETLDEGGKNESDKHEAYISPAEKPRVSGYSGYRYRRARPRQRFVRGTTTNRIQLTNIS